MEIEMKIVFGRIRKIIGGPCAIARILGFKDHQKVSHWFSASNIPYQFAVPLAFLTGIEIEKIAPYAKKANRIISGFLLNKPLPQFDNKKINKITIEPTSKLGERIIMTDDNSLISGHKAFKKMLRSEKNSKRIIVLPIDDILLGRFDLNILDFSNIEKLLIAARLNKVLKQNSVFTSDTVSKILLNILQVTLEELTFFDYLTKHASKKLISQIDLGAILVPEAYALVKDSEEEYKKEALNRQEYFEPSRQKSIKEIQDIILDMELEYA